MYSDLDRLAQEMSGSEHKLIVFHSEDQCCVDRNIKNLKLADFGTGPASFRFHSAVRSSDTAYSSTKKILDWAVKFPFRVHLAHVSTPYEIELVQEARKQGANITCEVAPHHLLFCDEDYEALGGWLKMNPPVRSREERALLQSYFAQSQIEVFATDHAPHTLSEKQRPYPQCPSGVPSIDFFAPLLLHCAEHFGLKLSDAIQMASANPATHYELSEHSGIIQGKWANLCVVDKVAPYRVSEVDVVSKCGWTPFMSQILRHKVVATIRKGAMIYQLGR